MKAAVARALSVLIENQNRALIFCFDAFSSREPVSTSLENALKKRSKRIEPGTYALLRLAPGGLSQCRLTEP